MLTINYQMTVSIMTLVTNGDAHTENNHMTILVSFNSLYQAYNYTSVTFCLTNQSCC